jgi:hypothetical protein
MIRTQSATFLTTLVLATAGLASSPATADGGPLKDLDRPNTEIFAGPPKVTDRANSVFRFKTYPRHGSTFTCAIDGQRARSCASPYRVHVKPGKHTIEILAKRDGVKEKKPATFTWTYEPTTH